MDSIGQLAAGMLQMRRHSECQIEVYLMTTSCRDGSSQSCVFEPQASLQGDNARLQNYLQESTQELNVVSERVNRGETVDHESRDWILTQVNFIVDTMGNEGLEIGDELRSDLLQLLLAFANLNEQIRRQTAA
jgi:ribosome assembly protein YihI (activator of Der GTPase)